MNHLRIENAEIGPDRPVMVIAEIGVNHDGSIERALELVDHAARAGANAVKLQIFRASELMHPSGGFADYQKQRCDDSDPRKMLKRYELSGPQCATVIAAIRTRGLIPLATPFSLADVETIATLNLPAVKIASPDLVNYPLIRAAARLGRPMLLSTGAANLDEIRQACAWLGDFRAAFSLLHCISSYPVPADMANLAWIGELSRQFAVPVGYSDHTTEELAGALAVAAGASIIEKHLTYDRTAQGPDHAASADPAEFARYVKAIRLAEAMRGRPGKCVLEIERDVRMVSRQSIVAVRDLPKGHVLSEGDLSVQRPGTGIPAARWPDLIGRKLKKTVTAGAMLGEEML